jgi:uncharacterized protein (TIGR02145 family)
MKQAYKLHIQKIMFDPVSFSDNRQTTFVTSGLGRFKRMNFVTVTFMLLTFFHASTAQDTISDADGNVYNTIQIGDQVWMKENLRTTKYSNGDIIGTTVPGNKDINDKANPKYVWKYAGKENNISIYGRLYTWYAVTDSRGICPCGWHIPNESDWLKLIEYLGGESVAGGKLKKEGTSDWYSPNVGATNKSGFTALPGGGRLSNGVFNDYGNGAIWWNAEGSGYYLNYSDAYIHKWGFVKSSGLSVRCVKNDD